MTGKYLDKSSKEVSSVWSQVTCMQPVPQHAGCRWVFDCVGPYTMVIGGCSPLNSAWLWGRSVAGCAESLLHLTF